MEEEAEGVSMEEGAVVTTDAIPGSGAGPADTVTEKVKSFCIAGKKQSPKKSGTDNQPPLPKLSYLSSLELHVFGKFVQNYVATREIRREDAVALDFLFGPTIQQVFEMVEEDHVAIRISDKEGLRSRRVLIEVCGKSGVTYWIPPGHSMCQCMSFLHGRKEYCKHVLAAHFYFAITPKENYKPISDEQLSKIYKDVLEEPLGLAK